MACSAPSSTRGRLAGAATTVVTLALVAVVMPGPAVVASTTTRTDPPTGVTANFPSGRAKVARVRAGAERIVSGRVAPAAGGRLVEVQSRGTNGSWVTLARTRTHRTGTFRVSAPTWWVARQLLRVHVPATATSAAASSADTGVIEVTRASRVRAGTAYTLAGGPSMRWDPCTPITYRLNPHSMPAGARLDLRKVFAQVSAATGLRFADVGSSTYVPFAASPGRHPANADIVLAWATPRSAPVLAGSTAGRGGAAWVGSGSTRELYDGEAVFDVAQRLSPVSSVQHRLMMQLYLHEVGHIIGLDHVADKRQLMYPVMQRSADLHYGAGDLAGLAVLGAAGGCNSVGAR